MSRPMDLNLLLALDALLDEESVTAAADRLGLSAPAMSRTLTRIRTAFGDPILVRSGRTMVATPRAQAIHAEVKALLDRSRALFAEGRPVDEAQLYQVFTVLASDYFPVHLATRLLPRLQSYAPGVSVAFSPEGQHLGQPLRDGTADLELGVISAPNPETRVEPLYTDHMLVVVRRGHPLTEAPLTPAALARALHITTSRRGRLTGPLDEALAARGLRRRVVAAMPTFTSTLLLVAASDLVALGPAQNCADLAATLGLATLAVPVALPPVEISLGWHPRHDNDPAQQWFREQVRSVLTAQTAGGSLRNSSSDTDFVGVNRTT